MKFKFIHEDMVFKPVINGCVAAFSITWLCMTVMLMSTIGLIW